MTNNNKIELPDWYKAERESGKTIERLTDTKELVFYLENPDPFIRRLAILRTGELKQKGSYTLLHDILDDNLETEENRELAALLMQKLNQELKLGFFISNSYLSHFTGNEDVDALLKIAIIDTFPDIRFHFENALIESQLNMDNEFLKSNVDEKVDVLPFTYKDWLSHCFSGIFTDIKRGIKNLSMTMLTALFIKGPRKILLRLASLLKSLKVHHKAHAQHQVEKAPQESYVKPVTHHRRKIKVYHPPLASRIKSMIRYFFNVLFIPFRIFYHFKWVILITLLVLYGILSFTQPGKSFLFRMNTQAYYVNTNFLNQTKASIINLIQSNNTLATVFKVGQVLPSQSETVKEEPSKKLVVTAPKGLYLRNDPVSTGKKLVFMEKNTTVEFFGEEERDGSGGKWFKVRFNEEKIGWANAAWLGEG